MNRLVLRSIKSYRDLRALNRELRFKEVIDSYNNLRPYSRAEDAKAKTQYLFALKNLPPELPVVEPKEPISGTESKPLYVKYASEKESSVLSSYLGITTEVALTIGFVLVLIFAMRGSGELFDSKKHIAIAEKTSITFSDVKGIDECREELEEIVNYLRNPHKFRAVGARMPKGVLLTGKPGVGKTLLAKAIAGEAGVHFFYVSGSDFEEIFVGIGAKRVRELFQQAKAGGPCIIFIDEIDALGSTRKSQNMNYNRQSLNQLLVEMDGFQPTDNVVVIAATNFPENLDNALTRAGRFDKTVNIPVPDIKGREEILALYLSKIKYDESVDKRIIARGSTGMTGADLANLVNLAMLNAVKRGSNKCSADDIEIAKDRVLMGVERKSLAMTQEDKMNTALHEVGHALTAVLTEGAQPLHKITILPRGQALGVTVLLPEKDELLNTRKQLLAQIDVAMGGRAAEEVFFGKKKVTTGCGSDLHNATRIAYYMVKGGMFSQDTGVICTVELENEGFEQRDRIDLIVKNLLSESYKRVFDMVQENRKLVKKIAKELAKRETLSREEFMEVMQDK